jgi:hypothetical protein
MHSHKSRTVYDRKFAVESNPIRQDIMTQTIMMVYLQTSDTSGVKDGISFLTAQ